MTRKKYQFTIQYDGSDFHGWQIQDNGRTVQGDIEKALMKVFKLGSINLMGSGRTDSGVHALSQIANFNVETNMNERQIKLATNSILKKDIYIKKCEIIEDEFHSRYSAIKREYTYKINQNYTPFDRKYSWYYNKKFKKDLLIESSQLILGMHDFLNFCKSSSRKEDNSCQVFESEWNFEKNEILYKICANRFLHHMVRMLVGTAMEVARKKISINQFVDMINVNSFSSSTTAFTAPAHGLFLSKIYYLSTEIDPFSKTNSLFHIAIN